MIIAITADDSVNELEIGTFLNRVSNKIIRKQNFLKIQE